MSSIKSQIKLYATGVTTADNVASAIVPINGYIVGISWTNVFSTSGTIGGAATAQLSLQSTGQFATNDCRNVLDECSLTSNAVATGVYDGNNKYTSLAGCKINAGDKIYLHRSSTQAFTSALINVVVTVA